MSCRLSLLVASVALVGGLVLAAAEPKKPLILTDRVDKKTYNIDELRQKLAYESLADRLAYEGKFPQRHVAAPKGWLDPEKGNLPVEYDAPPGFGVWGHSHARAESLEALHSEKVEAFVKREGFGMKRAINPSPSLWELPVVKAIPYPKLPDLPDDDSAGVVLPPRDAAAYQAMRWPGVDVLKGWNDGSRLNFVNPPGFGHLKDKEHVAGFQAHQFRNLPTWSAEPKSKETWAVRRLELVSLLKHETPAVYVDEHLPSMEALRSKDVKTRALTDFETQALKEVKEGKNVVAEATVNRIRMMGAIRATENCLKCHDAQRGDLLGTFSYELQRDPLMMVKK